MDLQARNKPLLGFSLVFFRMVRGGFLGAYYNQEADFGQAEIFPKADRVRKKFFQSLFI